MQSVPQYRSRLDELMSRAAVHNASLAKRLKTSEARVSRYRSGERPMSVKGARQIAPALRVEWTDLMMPIGTPLRSEATDIRTLVARRIEATIYAYWGDAPDERERAYADLLISRAQLDSITMAETEPSIAFLIRLLQETDITADWIFRGEIEHAPVPAEAAARIGSRFPELVGRRRSPNRARSAPPPLLATAAAA